MVFCPTSKLILWERIYVEENCSRFFVLSLLIYFKELSKNYTDSVAEFILGNRNFIMTLFQQF